MSISDHRIFISILCFVFLIFTFLKEEDHWMLDLKYAYVISYTFCSINSTGKLQVHPQ